MKDGYLITYKGNYYIVNHEKIVDGDLRLTIHEPYNKVVYKVLWCFEKEHKYARVYRIYTSGVIAQDLVPVQPMGAPRAELFLHGLLI
jgi:hypothetical protein